MATTKPKRAPSKSKNTGTGDADSNTAENNNGADDAALDERGANVVLPTFEERLRAAHNAADQELIDDIMEEYNTARRDEVRAQDKRDKRRREREAAREREAGE